MPDNVDLFPGYSFLTLFFELRFCSWISAESKCSLGAAKISLTESEKRTELATGCGCLDKLCPFPCSWVTHQETLSFLMCLLSIIMVATVIHPYRKARPCLNMPRRSCVTGRRGRWSAHIHHGHRRTCVFQLISWHSRGELCVIAYSLVTLSAPKPWFTD